MKRSEAVELINTALKRMIELKRMEGYSGGVAFGIDVPDYILFQLEAAGMLPPVTKLSNLNTVDNAWDEE